MEKNKLFLILAVLIVFLAVLFFSQDQVLGLLNLDKPSDGGSSSGVIENPIQDVTNESLPSSRSGRNSAGASSSPQKSTVGSSSSSSTSQTTNLVHRNNAPAKIGSATVSPGFSLRTDIQG